MLDGSICREDMGEIGLETLILVNLRWIKGLFYFIFYKGGRIHPRTILYLYSMRIFCVPTVLLLPHISCI